jgi:hypothetical protein
MFVENVTITTYDIMILFVSFTKNTLLHIITITSSIVDEEEEERANLPCGGRSAGEK